MKQYAEYDAISNEIGIILNKWDDGMYGRIGDEALILNRIHDENDRSKYTNSKLFFEKFIITIMYEYSLPSCMNIPFVSSMMVMMFTMHAFI